MYCLHAVQSSNINLPQNPHEIHVMNGKKRPLQWPNGPLHGQVAHHHRHHAHHGLRLPETGRIVAIYGGKMNHFGVQYSAAAVQFQVGYMGMGQNPGT